MPNLKQAEKHFVKGVTEIINISRLQIFGVPIYSTWLG